MSERKFKINYKFEGIDEVNADDFILVITPTLMKKDYGEEIGNKSSWHYVLSYNRKGEVSKLAEGLYPHSRLPCLERGRLRRQIKQKIKEDLPSELISDIVEAHFLARKNISHLEAAAEEV